MRESGRRAIAAVRRPFTALPAGEQSGSFSLIMPYSIQDRQFGSYLRMLRKKAGLTQVQLGAATHYSEGQICRFEGSKRIPPDLATLVAVFAPALGLGSTSPELKHMLELAALARGELPPGPVIPNLPATDDGTFHSNTRAPESQLPQPAGVMLGRDGERDACIALMRNSAGPAPRLITLLGPPGVGKTRLAIDIAEHIAMAQADPQTNSGLFPAGVFWISLASTELSDVALIGEELISRLGLRRSPAVDPLDDLASQLRDRRCLLVLDNAEHLLRGDNDLRFAVSALLQRTTAPSVLVTSQTPLGIAGEQAFPVRPLSTPQLARLPSLEELAQNAAVRLFVRNAQALKPSFALTAANALAIAGICAHLDGLPLAIELAAARIQMFAPEALLKRLVEDGQQRLGLLTRGARDAPHRHQSLENAIAWSYALLDPPTQAAFARLSVFANGCTLDGAHAVADASLPTLDTLIDHSLLSVEQQADGEPLFKMLETLRAFAHNQLVQHKWEDAARRRHATFMLGRARAIIRQTSDLAQRARILNHQQDDFRSAVRWMVSHDPVRALRLMCAAGDQFWHTVSRIGEGRHWLHLALTAAPHASPMLRSSALGLAGMLATAQSEFPAARQLLLQALALCDESDGGRWRFTVIHELGWLAYVAGDVAETRQRFQQIFEMSKRLNDRFCSAQAHHCAAVILSSFDNDIEQAQHMHEIAAAEYLACGRMDLYSEVRLHIQGLSVRRGDLAKAYAGQQELDTLTAYFPVHVRAWYASAQAELCILIQHPADALPHAADALTRFRTMGNRSGECIVMHHQAVAHCDLGHVEEAERLHTASLKIALELNDRFMITRNLFGLAATALCTGDRMRAAYLYGAARAQLSQLPDFIVPHDRARIDVLAERIRASLGPAAFEQHTLTGSHWNPDHAHAYAITIRPAQAELAA
jgi:predicted ATPase